jgi:hypothetical protein
MRSFTILPNKNAPQMLRNSDSNTTKVRRST